MLRARTLVVIAVAASGVAVLAGTGILARRAGGDTKGPVSPPVEPSAAASEPVPPPAASASAAASAEAPEPDDGPLPATLEAQREALFDRMRVELALSDAAMAEVRRIVLGSPMLGQGNPAVSKHPMTRAECRKRRAAAGLRSEVHPPCVAKNMAPVYDPTAGETAASARVCIDQFEFPGIPCEYPVVYARANEAAEICRAVGKRICDAHEWEGACAGALRPAEIDYEWGKPRPYATWLHNKARTITWAYGPRKDHTRCATGSGKSPKCEAGGWTLCGSNTYPAGSFPSCASPFGVFDLHGNAAEHMNLPLAPEELASRGGTGATEMKGSWFIFWREEAHEDDCRWRAKDWHPSKLMDTDSHRNYHLGFRCCADVNPPDAGTPGAGTPDAGG